MLAIPALCMGLILVGGPSAATAQTLAERLRQQATPSPEATPQMVVDAAELVYDADADTIGARGDVQLFYRGRTLQADRITYNRKTSRVLAEGRVRITEVDGSVGYAERAELTDDFRDGFIDSLRARSADDTHFTARWAERSRGETTVFHDGTYTACQPCKTDPSRPPFWRIRAKRIIHQNSEQMIYYEDAVFELWGYPIAWLPYFSTPDPSVRRKSGFLTPGYVARNRLGVGVSTPFFWAMAPNYDLTLTPTVLSRQGFLGQAEWRHRLVNGSYQVRATGIFQRDPGAFANPPYGPGRRHFRGSLETSGQFHINRQWKIGWDMTLLSDRWFIQDYRLPATALSQNYFRDSVSTVYMTGQGRRGYFDLRGYYFQGLARSDIQAQQPMVGPLLDYNKRIDVPPERTGGLGGQIEIDFNFTNVNRDLASFAAIGGRRLDRAFRLYDVCETAAGAPNYNRMQCLLRGMAGNYARASLSVEWKRRFVDPIGQVWTPFVFAHLNGSWLDLNTTGSKLYANPLCTSPAMAGPFAGTCASLIANSFQNTFFNQSNPGFSGSLTPGAGVEYRFPLVAQTAGATHVLEPIAQIVARPNEPRNHLRINEDAQSLVFDDTNLFSRSKFSGYDRFEGGVRVNYGVQYTATFNQGGYANLMVGQSFQLAGRNSYATADAANIGLGSGLDKRRSDIVARAAFAPNSSLNFIAKGRFDPGNLDLRRIDLIANMNVGPLGATLHYARYNAQPLIGFDKRREGLLAGARVKLSENISLNSNVIFDLSRRQYNNITPTLGKAPLFSVAGLGLGATYTDDCTALEVRYTSILESNGAGANVRNQTLMFSLRLRTVGDTRIRTNVSGPGQSDLNNAVFGQLAR